MSDNLRKSGSAIIPAQKEDPHPLSEGLIEEAIEDISEGTEEHESDQEDHRNPDIDLIVEDTTHNRTDEDLRQSTNAGPRGPTNQVAQSIDDAWTWFTNLRSKIEQSNQDIKQKIEKSNKNIEDNIKHSNKVIEERIVEGWDTFAHAPERAVEGIKQKREQMIEMQEEKKSKHWMHEKKLVSKYESLDYVTIYNKSYRAELYNKFFHVSGDFEWLRWVLSFVMGVVIGFIAYIAHFGIQNIQELKFEWIMEWAMDVNFALAFVIYLIINASLALLSTWLAVYYEPTAAGSGIPEVKAYLNGTKVPGFFRMKTLWTKLLSMIFANAASLQVGAEGPMIHIGASVGNGISQAQSKEFGFKIPFMKQFRNDRDKRDFITSGAGAGVAAAFGAPLGGTLFSLEEVASFWSTLLTWRTFFLCMVAVFAMKLFLSIESATKFDSGFMIFNIGSAPTQYRFYELIPFMLIGVIGGLLGALFTQINLRVTKFRGDYVNKKKQYRVLEVLAIVVVSSLLQYSIPFLFPCRPLSSAQDYRKTALSRHYCGDNQFNDLASIMFTSNEHAIYNLLSVDDASRLSFAAVLVFFLFYFFGAAYTAGCGISSGTFVPMIVIGSAYGRMIGLIVRYLYDGDIDPGIYAIMGAAAFMAGVSRLTVSLTVIVIEITNDLANLIPIMLVVMTAKWVSDPIIHPYFDKLIEMKHIPYLEPNPTKEMKLLMCKHVMARKPKFFLEKEKIGKILSVLKETSHNGFPIVNNNNERRVKGLILRSQLLVLLDRLSQIWIDRTDLVYSHTEYQTKLSWNLPPLEELLERFGEEDFSREIDLTPYINITVICVNIEFAVSEAYTIFRTMGLRHLPVVNEHNKLKGILTKKDLLEHNCEETYRELKALKKIDFNQDFPDDAETPIVSPMGTRVSSPVVSRRGSPVTSRRNSPAPTAR